MYAASPILRSALQLPEKPPVSRDPKPRFRRVTSLESALPRNYARDSVTHLQSTRFLRKMPFPPNSVSVSPAFTTLASTPSCKPIRMNTSAKHAQAPVANIPIIYSHSESYVDHDHNWSDHSVNCLQLHHHHLQSTLTSPPATLVMNCSPYARATSNPLVTPPATTPLPAAQPAASSKRHAFLVALGIFLSRIAGLIRDRIFAHYFGNSDAADAFKAAFRIPNFLQNLFGEGVLSASFIPVYAGLLARKDEPEARKVAGAVASLLALTTSLLVLIGVLATPYLIDAIAPGFHGEKRQLTIQLVRILFPGAGLLVFSAWCLGVLNSHRRFFLSYTAPVLWNAAMIATLWIFGSRYAQFPLAQILAWGSVVGSALQVAMQLPVVISLLRGFHFTLNFGAENIRTVVRNFAPVFISRGVVQISAF